MKIAKTLDLKCTGIEPLNKLETFILIEGTKHYYISSEGRLANDLHGKVYLHKETANNDGRVRWTVFYEGEDGKRRGKVQYADHLVAQAFLKKVWVRSKVWHIDGDISNSRYDNLICVSNTEWDALKSGNTCIGDLGRVQEYLPSLDGGLMRARKQWEDMHARCYNEKLHEKYPYYKDCCICKEWLEDKGKFYAWVKENYYSIEGENMDLDKDILCKGNKMYSPETCVFVPHSINTLFTNARKARGQYPLGVYYDKYVGKYGATVSIDGSNKKLGWFGTPEEAFAKYKKEKEANIAATAERYRGRIPDRLYRAMINWEVEIDD